MSGSRASNKVVVADFTIKAGMIDRFLQIADEHARITLKNEPGCWQLDVGQQDETHVVLYEVYKDEDRFRASSFANPVAAI